MKKFKLKQTIVVTVTGAQVRAIIVKNGTVLHEDSGYAFLVSSEKYSNRISFDAHGVESTPELFELVTEEK